MSCSRYRYAARLAWPSVHRIFAILGRQLSACRRTFRRNAFAQGTGITYEGSVAPSTGFLAIQLASQMCEKVTAFGMSLSTPEPVRPATPPACPARSRNSSVLNCGLLPLPLTRAGLPHLPPPPVLRPQAALPPRPPGPSAGETPPAGYRRLGSEGNKRMATSLAFC